MTHLKLLKNNLDRKWEDVEWVQEFYDFLTGKEVPDNIVIGRGHQPKLTPAKANTIIWYLQEHLSVIPDHIEQCHTCKEWYNSYSQGHYSELTGRCYCNEGCEPRGLYEREQKFEQRQIKLREKERLTAPTGKEEKK